MMPICTPEKRPCVHVGDSINRGTRTKYKMGTRESQPELGEQMDRGGLSTRRTKREARRFHCTVTH